MTSSYLHSSSCCLYDMGSIAVCSYNINTIIIFNFSFNCVFVNRVFSSLNHGY
ncbi:hypothetical protein HanXRQr2_Chr04g0175391 [Helianthus annuus]|uniref:Uncharacterized protein n=1 Tax=Helianthus annuus TaxID=4232 RepID=A0A9K3J9A5_HELAN|nr:hypothetical protein HanXRQr2_Chr04g0175391 [Helianthus annuus]